MKAQNWPEIPYENWKETCDTLHLWLQVAGKVRTHLTPWTNHSWGSTFYVTSSGLTTSLIPYEPGPFSIEFDFIRHRLRLQWARGDLRSFELKNESVSCFYQRLEQLLNEQGVKVHLSLLPDEVSDRLPFLSDTLHCTYDPDAAFSFWQTLVKMYPVFSEFRSKFLGKCSPIHFFWGAMDLACTRFSGRRAPEHPAGFPTLSDLIVKEAYSYEVSSHGFWPGDARFPDPAFYSYAYPQPLGFESAGVTEGAFYHEGLKEFILPYETVRKNKYGEKLLYEFFQKTYEAAAILGVWDRDLLESSAFLTQIQIKQRAREPSQFYSSPYA